MGIFSKFGDLIIRLFSLVGMLIMSIPKIPQKIRNLNTGHIREKIGSENLRGNISQIKKDIPVEDTKGAYSQKKEENPASEEFKKDKKISDSGVIYFSGQFTSEEKESTILRLQIASAAFLVFTIIYIFNFLSLILFILIGGLTVAYILYILFKRVKIMFSRDFNAYRDFFLMYVAVGIILIIISTNPNLVLAFSFQFLPSLSILLYAVIAVAAVFLIFRIRYHRNFTYGTVVEAGKHTAHVKVEYDIRANIKPDLYLVENKQGAAEGDTVKLKIEEKILSTGGNRPVGIIEIKDRFRI